MGRSRGKVRLAAFLGECAFSHPPTPANLSCSGLLARVQVAITERIVGSHGWALVAGDVLECSIAESTPRCQRGATEWYELFHVLGSQRTFVITVIFGVWGNFEG